MFVGPCKPTYLFSHDSPIGLDSDLTVYVGHHIGQTPVVRDTSMLPFGPTPPATFHPQGPSIGSIPTEGWDNSAHHDPSHGNQISPVNQTAIISGWNSSPAPISIEKESWYSQYGINRDADGWFHCPHAGCIDKKKRRDQLWEHWKARHNNDPYRCSSWSVFPCNDYPLHALNPISAVVRGLIMAKRAIHALQK